MLIPVPGAKETLHRGCRSSAAAFTVHTGLRIYCADRGKMIQECKKPIASGDFNGFLQLQFAPPAGE